MSGSGLQGSLGGKFAHLSLVLCVQGQSMPSNLLSLRPPAFAPGSSQVAAGCSGLLPSWIQTLTACARTQLLLAPCGFSVLLLCCLRRGVPRYKYCSRRPLGQAWLRSKGRAGSLCPSPKLTQRMAALCVLRSPGQTQTRSHKHGNKLQLKQNLGCISKSCLPSLGCAQNELGWGGGGEGPVPAMKPYWEARE